MIFPGAVDARQDRSPVRAVHHCASETANARGPAHRERKKSENIKTSDRGELVAAGTTALKQPSGIRRSREPVVRRSVPLGLAPMGIQAPPA